MRVHRIAGRRGVTATLIVTEIPADEAPLELSVNSQITSRDEFERRVRYQRLRMKMKRETWVGPLPLMETGTTLEELERGHAAEIEHGRAMQHKMFGESYAERKERLRRIQ